MKLPEYDLVVFVLKLLKTIHFCNFDEADLVELVLFFGECVDELVVVLCVGFVTPIGCGLALFLACVHAHEIVDDALFLVVDVVLLVQVEVRGCVVFCLFGRLLPIVHEGCFLFLYSFSITFLRLCPANRTRRVLVLVVFYGEVENL